MPVDNVPARHVRPPPVKLERTVLRRQPEGTFIGVIPAGSPVPEGVAQVNIVLNWYEELKRLVPTD
jgi:hypothetical protein